MGITIVFISMVIRLNCFSKMWCISLPRILQNNDLQCWIKTAGVITNDGFPECIILYNALCTMHAGETMHCKPCYKSVINSTRLHMTNDFDQAGSHFEYSYTCDCKQSKVTITQLQPTKYDRKNNEVTEHQNIKKFFGKQKTTADLNRFNQGTLLSTSAKDINTSYIFCH